MAFQQGTANGSIDLWDKLIAFLTTDLSLVAAGEQWTVMQTFIVDGQPRVVLRGNGSTPDDKVYVSLARTDSADTDSNNIRIVASSGFLPDATSWNQHVNTSPEVRIWLDGGPMKYWFVANGRRFIIVANMSTVYQSAYAGFYLPYSDPLAYRCPLFVGGSANTYENIGNGGVTSWRSQSDYHSQFPYSGYNTSGLVPDIQRVNAYMLDNNGAWVPVASMTQATINTSPNVFDVDPDGSNRWKIANGYSYSEERVGINTIMARMTRNFGGGYMLTPITLTQRSPGVITHGILDGAYLVPGVSNAVENIVTIGGVDHLVVQNVWRTTTRSYWALRLD